MELLEIKRLWPEYNSALKMPKNALGIVFITKMEAAMQDFRFPKVTKHLQPVETFFSLEEANTFLKGAIETI